MKLFVALLRGINVSGSNKIIMEDLRGIFSKLGFEDVKTYLQSGNVVFRTSIEDEKEIKNKIKTKILAVFGYDLSIIIISKESFVKIFEYDPYIENIDLDSKKMYTIFLSENANIELFEEIKNNPKFPEEMVLRSNIIYMYYTNGYGKSKVTNNYFERKLKIIATTRNRRTVSNLESLLKVM